MIEPSALFKALADDTRFRCLMLMVTEGEICINEFGTALNDSQPDISRQMASLRKCRIVTERKEGRWEYYIINAELPAWAKSILQAASEGITGLSPYEKDRQSLRKIRASQT